MAKSSRKQKGSQYGALVKRSAEVKKINHFKRYGGFIMNHLRELVAISRELKVRIDTITMDQLEKVLEPDEIIVLKAAPKRFLELVKQANEELAEWQAFDNGHRSAEELYTYVLDHTGSITRYPDEVREVGAYMEFIQFYIDRTSTKTDVSTETPTTDEALV